MKKVKLLFNKFLGIFKSKKEKLEQKVSYLSSISQMPYVVNIENTTDKIIENVSLFFGNSQNELAFSSDGSYRENGLIISSGVANVTYNHIVKNFITKKCNVRFTYIQSVNTLQIIEKFSIKKQDANGCCEVRILTPKIDPYQQQSNIIAVKENYILDGDTAIVLHKVHPKTILKMYFYPEINIDNLAK